MKNIHNKKIESPCISICKTDPRTGYCYGCARTEKEKIIWKEKKTKSILQAIEETDRRRKLQLSYNKKNNISATSIKKEITDILESIYERDYTKINVDTSIGHNLKKHLKSLKKKMKEAAENLEFEEAAKIRDEIRK